MMPTNNAKRVSEERRAARALERAALRRMVLPKNRAKGSWAHIPVLELVALARAELDEVEAAVRDNEGLVRVDEELGDAAAYIAMALDGNGASCCCYADDDGHTAHCPGYFVNEETTCLERCDECAVFGDDDEVVRYLRAKELERLDAEGDVNEVLGKHRL